MNTLSKKDSAPGSPAPADAAPIRLGILQTGRTPEGMIGHNDDYHMLFVNLLGESEFDYRHWVVLDNEFPASIDDADAWLITGSRHGAYEDHDWIPPLEDFIRAVFAAGQPMVGICFGHQVIAQALGGKVEKFDGGWSVGRVDYALDSSVFPDAASSTGTTPLMAFHQDQVVEAPDSAVTVGSTSFCKHAALLYDNRILTIQPHPEFNKQFVGDLLIARGEILPKNIKDAAEQTLEQPLLREPIAHTMRNFLKRPSA